MHRILLNSSKRVNAIVLKLFHKGETERTLLKSFLEVTATLRPKPHKEPKMKENYRPVSFMHTEAKVLNKIATNQI